MAKTVVDAITIEDEHNDDWMKTLPGYADEVAIHEQLAARLKSKKEKKVLRFKKKNDID